MPTEWDFEYMAWHEAGHAVVSLVLPEQEPIERISIEPGDEAFGFMRTVPRPHHNGTEVSLRSAMAVFLAGPLAERRFLGRSTTSGADDIANARAIARDMVLRFGMGPRLGLHGPAISGEAISEHHLRAVEADEQRLLRAAERAAKTALHRNAPLVRALAEALLTRRTLLADDIAILQESVQRPLFSKLCGLRIGRICRRRSQSFDCEGEPLR